ncbi:MAG: ECF transporter S component [Promethearchaeota archaeon]
MVGGESKVGPAVPESKKVAYYAIFTALTVILNVINIPMPMPIQYLGFAPVLIIFLGVLLKPKRAFTITSIGSVLGQFFSSLILGSTNPIEMLVFCTGAFVARGFEALFISVLVKYLVRGKELPPSRGVALMVTISAIATAWEVLGYFIVGASYYMYIIPGLTLGEVFLWYVPVFIDIVSIPIAIAVIEGVRAGFNVDYLDGLMYSDHS